MISYIKAILRGRNSSSLLVRGSVVSFSLQATGAMLLLVSEMLLARRLGADGYGLFAFVMAWLQVLNVVALMGSNHLLLRYVPGYVAAENWMPLNGMVSFCALGTVAISLAIILMVIIGIHYNILPGFATESHGAVLVGLLVLPIYALAIQRQAILRGFHKVFTALFPEHIFRPLLLIIMVLFYGLFQEPSLSPITALIMNGVCVFLAFLLGWYWLRDALPGKIYRHVPIIPSGAWINVAVPLFVISGLQMLISRLDIIMLGVLASGDQAGVYAAASRVSDLVVFVLASANAIVAPLISGLYAQGKVKELQGMMSFLSRIVFWFTVPMALVLIVFGRSILGAFGDEYMAGYAALVILVVGQSINALCGPVGYLMAMTGYQKQSMYIFGVAALLNIVLNAVLIPMYWIMGAAIATAITTALWNIAMLRFVKRHLKIDSSIFTIMRAGQ